VTYPSGGPTSVSATLKRNTFVAFNARDVFSSSSPPHEDQAANSPPRRRVGLPIKKKHKNNKNIYIYTSRLDGQGNSLVLASGARIEPSGGRCFVIDGTARPMGASRARRRGQWDRLGREQRGGGRGAEGEM